MIKKLQEILNNWILWLMTSLIIALLTVMYLFVCMALKLPINPYAFYAVYFTIIAVICFIIGVSLAINEILKK